MKDLMDDFHSAHSEQKVVDHMVKAVAEHLKDGELVYVGLNSFIPLLASFMARDLMKKKVRIAGVSESYDPPPITLSPSTGQPSTEAPVMTTVDIFDLAQRGRLDVMFFGPAQVDGELNVNISIIGDPSKPKVRLPGGAATAFLLPLAKRVFLWNVNHSRVLVPKVDFITGTARNSHNQVMLFTDLGCLSYDREERAWSLLHTFPWTNFSMIKDMTKIPILDRVEGQVVLTKEDQDFLDQLDPQGLRTILEK